LFSAGFYLVIHVLLNDLIGRSILDLLFRLSNLQR